MSEASADGMVETTVVTFDGITGELLSTEIVLVPAPPAEALATDALAAQTARLDVAVQEGWLSDEQRSAIVG